MAINPTAPGVYIEEVPTLPASVVPVATAIPAFIGYTEKAENNGDRDAFVNIPVRITSMLEFETTFGGPYNESVSLSLGNPIVTGGPPVVTISPPTFSEYALYYHMLMYFANGGGPCYIVSVGLYGSFITNAGLTIDAITNGDLDIGIDAVEKVDEVTLLVVPEAIASTITTVDRYNKMLAQCALLQDRFSILDVKAAAATVALDASAFRSSGVGNNNLKYGSAYYPPLNTSNLRAIPDEKVIIDDNRSVPIYPTVAPFATLGSLLTGEIAATAASGVITITNNANLTGDTFKIDTITFTMVTTPPTGPTNVRIGSTVDETAKNLTNAINSHASLQGIVTASWYNATVFVKAVTLVAATGNAIDFVYTDGGTVGATMSPSAGDLGGGVSATSVPRNLTLYNQIRTMLDAYTVTLSPSATMAGIYASVDRTRGVWKAPANVSINLVTSPKVLVNVDDNGLLNVDATSGKSINAIRTFAGKGTLVWGARTLAGNDNEWRYVNVRRLFIMAEESIKKATEFLVFEPNDANTWATTKSLINNFLTNLWRDGALAGAKPEQAFFVKVGLNETMSAQDILEGKMIVQVGMAAVRPAEFIILQFMHKLQES
ncbi:MAG: hypothetical protein FD123_2549 [Bacteroidetes bacterium]|nr:MAG: hypothetical protein FD123_2549 [Bacteroidota bacterium]